MSQNESEEDSSALYQELLQRHIEAKVDAALRRALDQRLDDGELEGARAEDGMRHRVSVKGDIIPTFDPDNPATTAEGWLQKIDQLGDVHGWTDYERSCFMQVKLRGPAKDWFDRLDGYNRSWAEWKIAVTRAFPRHTDYAAVLEQLVARKKRSDETMTHYFHAKLALVQQCRLDDDAAISCVIRGLPLELQANARAYQCTTPDKLYSDFIAPLENYESPAEHFLVKRSRHENGPGGSAGGPSPGRNAIRSVSVECYRCGKKGHISKDCRLKGSLRCYSCNRYGHKKDDCRFRNQKSTSVQSSSDSKQVKLIDMKKANTTYLKQCYIGPELARAYVDTGSQVNIIAADYVKKYGLSTYRSSNMLKGFGGGTVSADLEVKFVLKIDQIEMETSAVVADADMSGVDLIVGQPIVNEEGVIFVVNSDKCQLLNEVTTTLGKITLTVDEPRPKVVLESDVCLAPNTTTMVHVKLLDVKDDVEVLMNSQHYQLGDSLIRVPGVVCKGLESRIPVTNTGREMVTWKKGKLIGRGERCDRIHEVRSLGVSFEKDERNESYVIESEKVKVGKELDESSKAKLLALLNKWSSCFARNFEELGVVKGGKLEIKLKDESKTVCYRPYRLSFAERQVVREKVDELLKAGIIRESQSDFASPVVLVKKKNGEYRMCVDFRALNKMTIKDVYPMSNIEEQLSSLAGKIYFTSLDCSHGFHQIEVEEKSIPKTSFITPDGHYEYLKMPFGLVNAPSVFQRLINTALGVLRFYEVLIYMDDLLIASDSIEEGLRLLELVLSLLHEAGFKLNLEKCSFLMTSLQYLGHEITPQGISPGSVKIDAVNNFKRPTNVHEIRQFIGLAGYFRKFVEKFAVIALPLTKLTRKNVPFVWGEAEEAAFQELKQRLITKPILVPFNHLLETQVHTDASSKGIGGILLQVQSDKQLKPVAYFSRVTSPGEQVLHSYELETLAVIESLQRYRIYLIGSHFKIVTDCSAIRYTFAKRDLIPRIARWWLKVQEYDFEIEHRPGDSMKHVDALSRNAINTLQISSEDWFLAIQLQDDSIKQIVEQIINKTNRELDRQYIYRNNRLYRKTLAGERLVIPRCARFNILQKYHDEIGHPGLARCMKLIKENFWFARMSRFIGKYVNSCLKCAYKKGTYGKPEGELHPIQKPDTPMHTVHIDHVGPYPKSKSGFSYILTMVDSFTKYMVARPTRTLGSAECLKNLRAIFGEFFGYPNRLISDNGKAFTSKNFTDFMCERQIKHVLTAVATPRANGQVERFHRTLLDAMRASGDDGDIYWDNKLPEIMWGINNTVNASTKYTPYELMFGHKGNLLKNMEVPSGNENSSVEAKRKKARVNMEKVAKKMKMRYDRGRKAARKYRKGELVLWRDGRSGDVKGVNRKLMTKFTGPYVVEKVFEGDRYRIRSVKGMRGYKNFRTLVAVDSLRPLQRSTWQDDSSSSDDSDNTPLIDLVNG